MKMATRAIPLVADTEPVEVLYEDDDIIAVNKPAGVTSGPKHRYKVSRAGCLHRAKFTQSQCLGCARTYFAGLCTVTLSFAGVAILQVHLVQKAQEGIC